MKKKLSPSAADHIRNSKVKLFLIAAILVILAALLPTKFSQSFAEQQGYNSRLVAYPQCILTGRTECSMATSAEGPRAVFRVHTLYDVIGFFLLGGLTCVNLIFPLKPSDFRKIRNKLCCLCEKYRSKLSKQQTWPVEV